MSNTTFKSVKNTKEPFSSLNASESTIFGGTSGTIQVSGNILPGDKPYKVIELFGDEFKGILGSNILRDSSGVEWTVSEDIVEIIGVEFTATYTGISSGVSMKIRRSDNSTGPTIIQTSGPGSNFSGGDTKTMKVSFLHSKPLASGGSPIIITFEKDDKLYITPNTRSSYLMNVYVKLYYR